jgi:2-polyprenyl-6-methoxyphenol hydroxylase-like FAD-dependent oxidoreductase
MRLSEPILIAGGGIGGLAAALALRQRGFPVEVYERREDREIQLAGTGLTIWSNATTALGWLGLAAQVRTHGAELVRVCNVTDDGSVIFRTPVQKYTAPGSLPGVSISRGDLVAMLLEACESAGVAVHFGQAVTGYTIEPSGVAAKLADGGTVHGSLLVGADGVRSAVRAQLCGELKRIYTGNSAYRGISADDGGIEPGTAYLFESRSGVTGGAWRVSGNRMAWTFGRRAEAAEPDPDEGRKQRVLQMLAAFQGKAPAIVAGTPEERIVRTDIYYHDWDAHWGEGPVTLLGDAAHAVPTVLGQGACQAIEDAVVLADALAAADDPAQGLRDYEGRRVERVMFIRDKILGLMNLPKITNPVVLWIGRKLLRVMITFTQAKLWRTLQQPPQLYSQPGSQPVATTGLAPR